MITIEKVVEKETKKSRKAAEQAATGEEQPEGGKGPLAGVKKYLTPTNIVIAVVVIGGIAYFVHQKKKGTVTTPSLAEGVSSDIQSTHIQ